MHLSPTHKHATIWQGVLEPQVRHVPDAIIERPTGRLIAVELELSPKTPNRLQAILDGYAAEKAYDLVPYLVPGEKMARYVARFARGLDRVQSEFFAAAPRMELTMSGKPNPAGDDHIGLLLASTVIGVVIVFATPAPFVIAMGIFTVGRLLGYSCGVRASCWERPGSGWRTGAAKRLRSSPASQDSSRPYLNRPDWARQLPLDWLATITDLRAWMVTSPIGLIGSACFLLAREDEQILPKVRFSVGVASRRH